MVSVASRLGVMTVRKSRFGLNQVRSTTSLIWRAAEPFIQSLAKSATIRLT